MRLEAWAGRGRPRLRNAGSAQSSLRRLRKLVCAAALLAEGGERFRAVPSHGSMKSGPRRMNAAPYRPPVTISRDDFRVDGSDADFRRSIYAMVQSVGRLLACREAFGRELSLTSSQFAVLMGVAHCQQREG